MTGVPLRWRRVPHFDAVTSEWGMTPMCLSRDHCNTRLIGEQ
jgi:hypothetical protein